MAGLVEAPDVADLSERLLEIVAQFRDRPALVARAVGLLADLVKMHTTKGPCKWDVLGPAWLRPVLVPWIPVLVVRARGLLGRFQNINGKERHEIGAQLKTTQVTHDIHTHTHPKHTHTPTPPPTRLCCSAWCAWSS